MFSKQLLWALLSSVLVFGSISTVKATEVEVTDWSNVEKLIWGSHGHYLIDSKDQKLVRMEVNKNPGCAKPFVSYSLQHFVYAAGLHSGQNIDTELDLKMLHEDPNPQVQVYFTYIYTGSYDKKERKEDVVLSAFLTCDPYVNHELVSNIYPPSLFKFKKK